MRTEIELWKLACIWNLACENVNLSLGHDSLALKIGLRDRVYNVGLEYVRLHMEICFYILAAVSLDLVSVRSSGCDIVLSFIGPWFLFLVWGHRTHSSLQNAFDTCILIVHVPHLLVPLSQCEPIIDSCSVHKTM